MPLTFTASLAADGLTVTITGSAPFTEADNPYLVNGVPTNLQFEANGAARTWGSYARPDDTHATLALSSAAHTGEAVLFTLFGGTYQDAGNVLNDGDTITVTNNSQVAGRALCAADVTVSLALTGNASVRLALSATPSTTPVLTATITLTCPGDE